MTVDPFRLAIALVPIGAYILLLAWINAYRRPFVTSGASDLAALGIALSGLVFVGPLELLRPESATRHFGNYIWLVLLLFYWLWLVLVVLLSRPRLVVYNISLEQLRPLVAEAAARVDPAARWAGNHLTMPALAVHLHLDSFDAMRNVSLVSSGGQQNIDGWRKFARELRRSLGIVRVPLNPRAIGFAFGALILLAGPITYLLARPDEVLRAFRQVFAFGG